jgi:hypothetical protein
LEFIARSRNRSSGQGAAAQKPSDACIDSPEPLTYFTNRFARSVD